MLVDAVRQALTDLGPTEVDNAAAELAVTYAQAIDGGEPLDKLGPQLLTVLESLGMTPKARATIAKGVKNEPTRSPLDELRARRAARQRGPAAMDTAAT